MKPHIPSGPAASRRKDAALRLSRFLPYRLSVLSNTVSREFARIYEGEFGLTLWQWRVMAVLGETDGLTASEIVSRTAMDKVVVSSAVAGLRADGRLVRKASRADRRALTLSLSADGRALYHSLVPRILTFETHWLSSLSTQEVETLIALMDKLAGAISPARPLWDKDED